MPAAGLLGQRGKASKKRQFVTDLALARVRWHQIWPAMAIPCFDHADLFGERHKVRMKARFPDGIDVDPKAHQAKHIGGMNALGVNLHG